MNLKKGDINDMIKTCNTCRHLNEDYICENPRFRVHESTLFNLIGGSSLYDQIEEIIGMELVDENYIDVNDIVDGISEAVFEEIGNYTETLITEPETFWCADYEANSV